METLVIDEKEIIYLNVDKILPNPYQSRKLFDSKALEELTKSIRKYGIIKPITVRPIGNEIYEIISGERRLKACKMIGFTQIPTFIKDISSKESIVISLVENMQREKLNFFEEAETFQKLMVDFGCSIEEISEIVNKSQNFIFQKMQLLSLKKEVRQSILENNITEKQALALLKIKCFKTQLNILEQVVKHNLNLKHTEKLVESTLQKLNGYSKEIQKTQKIKGIIRDVRIFTNTIKNAVDIMQDSGFDTNYNVVKNDDEYEITIKVSVSK